MTLTRTLVRAAAALTATGLVATGAVAQSASIVKKPVPGADGLAVSADGSKVWVIGANEGTVFRFKSGQAFGTPFATRTGEANFIDAWATPSGGRAYVLDEDDQALHVIRWGSKGTFTTLKTGVNPTALVGGTARGQQVLYILNVGTTRQSVTVINRSTNTVSKTWNLPKSAGGDAQSMALAPDGQTLYVGSLSGQGTAAWGLSTKTGKVVQNIKTTYPGDPNSVLEVDSLAVDSSNKFLYLGAGAESSPKAGTYKVAISTGKIAAKRMVNQNFMQALAVAGNSRVVAMSGNSITAAPGTLQVLKRKNLKPSQDKVILPVAPSALGVSESASGALRAHVTSTDDSAYWSIPIK